MRNELPLANGMYTPWGKCKLNSCASIPLPTDYKPILSTPYYRVGYSAKMPEDVAANRQIWDD